MRRRLSPQTSSENLAALEPGSKFQVSRPISTDQTSLCESNRHKKAQNMVTHAYETSALATKNDIKHGDLYAFSYRAPRAQRWHSLLSIFPVVLIAFAVFALSKLPFIFDKVFAGEAPEFSANLQVFGISTGVKTTRHWTFIVPHIVVAALLEILCALIIARRLRMTRPLVCRALFALTLIHCIFIIPNWKGLPGPAGNIVFVSICLLAAFYLQFVDAKSKLAFSWLVVAINSGPVGEFFFWLMLLTRRLNKWQIYNGESNAENIESLAMGEHLDEHSMKPDFTDTSGFAAVLIIAIGVSLLVLLVFFFVICYNIFFFTRKYGLLCGLCRWTKGIPVRARRRHNRKPPENDAQFLWPADLNYVSSLPQSYALPVSSRTAQSVIDTEIECGETDDGDVEPWGWRFFRWGTNDVLDRSQSNRRTDEDTSLLLSWWGDNSTDATVRVNDDDAQYMLGSCI